MLFDFVFWHSNNNMRFIPIVGLPNSLTGVADIGAFLMLFATGFVFVGNRKKIAFATSDKTAVAK
jgi:hypothetical protein